MREVTLKEYADEERPLHLIAEVMGVTAGAITQMLTNRRDIRVVLDESGQPTRAYEIRKFPRSAVA